MLLLGEYGSEGVCVCMCYSHYLTVFISFVGVTAMASLYLPFVGATAMVSLIVFTFCWCNSHSFFVFLRFIFSSLIDVRIVNGCTGFLHRTYIRKSKQCLYNFRLLIVYDITYLYFKGYYCKTFLMLCHA